MQKKKIKKLEIKKEDILNLSNDEAQRVIGGGANTNTPSNDCSTEWCTKSGCDGGDTDPCSVVIGDTDLCGVSDNCQSGWCQTGFTQDVAPECNRT
ncbi:class I lanthipeptide [Chryseobacterium polytrichastri]|uniref:Natural product n=1 Tax=Chryseobacterium polytrichastri TaxID=1302687 RepID=A0A1M6X277_9FLAO|nr:class I lanthipeptide [Chryseobacterium polytrichastri]SHL00001.1 hypothetical protein SAMN05444267_101067 [Chryseobacterium polytrichastri]